jgi:hypothetical protein
MALYLKEVALLETTTNTLLKLTNVMEGIANSATFGYEVENVNIAINANQTEQIVNRHTFKIAIKDDQDPTNQAIMTAWANNPELRFKASGYSGDTFFLWDEPVPIVFSRQYDGIVARVLTMTLDAKPGFNGASGLKKLPVYAGQNLLGIYNVLGANGGSTLNGFISVGLVGDGVTGANQTIEIDGTPATSYLESADLLFPFASAQFTISATCVSTDDEFTAGIATFLANGTLIGRDYATTAINGSGRLVQQELNVGATGVFLRIGFSGSANLTSVFNTPAIRLGYETSFTN